MIDDHFSLDGIGLTADTLNLDAIDFDALRDDFPAFPTKLRHQAKGWWTTTEAEEFYLDLPPFRSAQERALYMITQMCRAALTDVPGSTAEDPLFDLDSVRIIKLRARDLG